mgnify:FL=1
MKTTVVADGSGREKKVHREEVDILEIMDAQEALAALRKQMRAAADRLALEEAAKLRDEILRIESVVKTVKSK